MYRFQSQLPRLPVPELSETCALYLRMVRPLVGDADFAATQRAVEEFLRPGGEGEVLQERLLRWRDTPGVDNWLERFWDDWYLLDDTPLLVNVSPGLALSGGPCPQIPRAARLLAAALRFKALVDSEELEPDLIRGVPQCMSEYPRLLASTRIPGATRDHLEQYPDSRTVVVVRNNRFFELEVLDESGRPFGVEQLRAGAPADRRRGRRGGAGSSRRSADDREPAGVGSRARRAAGAWACAESAVARVRRAGDPRAGAGARHAAGASPFERGRAPVPARRRPLALVRQVDAADRGGERDQRHLQRSTPGSMAARSHRFVAFLVENEDRASGRRERQPRGAGVALRANAAAARRDRACRGQRGRADAARRCRGAGLSGVRQARDREPRREPRWVRADGLSAGLLPAHGPDWRRPTRR